MIQPSSRLNAFSAQDIKTAIDAAQAPGKLRVYSGIRPLNAAAVTGANTMLIEFDLFFPCGEVNDTSLIIYPPITKMVQETGTASFLRFLDASSNTILDMDAIHASININMVAGKFTAVDYILIQVGA